MAMFPPAIPNVMINWLTDPGDVVYDPFSGRGTAPLEACLLGRRGVGSDANPLAWVLTSAKVDPPTSAAVIERFGQLRNLPVSTVAESQPDHIRMLFSAESLKQLVLLREHLDLKDRTDRFVMAVLLGILHGNANRDGSTRGLSIPMPNTFSMAPGYVERYIKKNNLRAPVLDILTKLEARVLTFVPRPMGFTPGRAWLGDARASRRRLPQGRRAKLILTSPPYLEVMKYGKFNWIRLWMLQTEAKAVDRTLFTSASVPRYVEFMTSVIANCRASLRDDGYVCLVLGDVAPSDRTKGDYRLAHIVRDHCLGDTDLRVLGVITDRLPVQHKVSRIWGDGKGHATKTDRILILGGPNAAIPGAAPSGRVVRP
jgi:site-specific DNA-methyltransferase (adenine-specific)